MSFLKSKYEKQLSSVERIQSKKDFIQHHLPLTILIITGIFGTLDGLSAIAFGIAAIVHRSPLWYVGVG